MLTKIIVPIAGAMIKEGGKKAILPVFALGVGCMGIKFYEIYCNHSQEKAKHELDMYREYNLHKEAMNGTQR